MNLKRVFTPITLNQMTVKNRLAMTAMHLLYTEDGSVNQRTKEFYLARARGGVGMIIAGGAAADPYIGYSHMLRMDQDRFVPGWKDLADAVHAYDCKLCVQFLTPGRYGRAEFVEGDTDLLSASDVYAKMTGTTPRPMTAEEIRRIQENYARAALRCKQAGIDGVEITAGSGYLICQFLSPVTNKREDAYGGSFDNRCRFGVELVQAVRDAVGPDYPVMVRVAGNDFVSGGCTNEDCVAFCKKLEQDKILFIPDPNLGHYVAEKLPEKTFAFYKGGCPRHIVVSAKDVEKARAAHPDALFLVHPECRQEVVEQADYVGSTTGIMEFAKKSEHKEFIIGTENSIVEHLQFECPDKKFYPVAVQLTCMNMKVTTLMDIYNCLKGQGGEEIFLPENIMEGAGRCIHRMVELGG